MSTALEKTFGSKAAPAAVSPPSKVARALSMLLLAARSVKLPKLFKASIEASAAALIIQIVF